MKIAVVNNNQVRHNYLSSFASHKACKELEKYYGPYELFSKVATYFRTSYELPSYIGKGVYNNIDYIIQKMTDKMSQNPNLSASLFGGGKGSNFNKLYISTLGEMFERIIGAISYYQFKDSFIFGSYNELKKKYNLYPPKDIEIFAEEQFNDCFIYEKFTNDTQLRWVQGKQLLNNENIYVPAQLIFIFYPFETPNEARIGYATSGGLSLHDNRKLAIYHGITECIERDSINIRWYNKIPPEIIDLTLLENLSNYGKSIINHKKIIGNDIRVYYHNLDLHEFPVVTTISFDNNLKKFSFCAGGGVDNSIEGAIESSFKEYGQSELNLRSLFYNPNWFSSKSMIKLFGFDDFNLEDMKLFYEIVPYYGLKENRKKLNWYLKNNKTFKKRELNIDINYNRYHYLLEVLKKYKINPVILDLTPEGFDNIKLIKSYLPELTAAFLPNAPCLGHRRFYNLAFEQGLVKEKYTFDKLNKEALPFP